MNKNKVECLDQIVKHFEGIWNSLKKKYSKARGDLVFAKNGEFVNIRCSLSEILKKNHFVFEDGDAKMRALDLINSSVKYFDGDILLTLENADFDIECRVEIIWDDLEYETIYEMQHDELIDGIRTPKGRSSIRIVLGVIGDAFEGQPKRGDFQA